MTSLIKVPFASSGDKTVVPETDAGGAVNMMQGYGQAYSLDPSTDPSAKRIEREKMNWLFNLITKAINEIQLSGVATFITSADNGGAPFAYGKGALVSLGGVVYQSLTATNTSNPPGANWSAVPEKIQPLDATLSALAALVGAANKLPYFSGADTAALTDLTSVGRDIIGKTDTASVLAYLGIPALLELKAGTDGCELVGFFGGDKGRPYVKQKTSGDNIVLATAENMNNQLGAKAPLASPAFTGTPTAPTPAQTVNSTQIATTAFVKAAVAALVDSSPGTLDTLNELAAALGDDPNFATTMTSALARKIDGDNCGAAGFVGGAAGSPYLRHAGTDTVITLATMAALSSGLALKPGTDGCELVGFFGNDKGRPYVKQKSSSENIVLATAENLANRLAEKMDNSGFAGTLGATTGNQQLGTGKLIIQYGEFSIGAAAGANATVTFNRAFPNACVVVIPTPGSGGSAEQLGVSSKNKTQATITKGIGDVNARSGSYVALGY